MRHLVAAATGLTFVWASSVTTGEEESSMSEKGKIVFSDTFEEGLDNWVIEKWEEDKISAEHKDGMMHVTTHDTTNGVMIWCKKELPASFLFEFDMTPHSPSGFFLVFFCAKGRNGEDITSKEMLAQKSAKTLFKKYTKGTIDCYHTSYRRNEVADCNRHHQTNE